MIKTVSPQKNLKFFNKISFITITQIKVFDKLIYHINKINGVKRLYISDVIIKNILDIAYSIINHLKFARYYERVAIL